MKFLSKTIAVLTAACICISSGVLVYADDLKPDEQKENIIVINGVEYDTTGMTEAEIDALKQQNVASAGVDTADESLNNKLNPSYTIDSFFSRGWNREFAPERTNQGGNQSAAGEEASEYPAALELVINSDILPKLNGKMAADEKLSVSDFKAAAGVINKYTEQAISTDGLDDKGITADQLASCLAAALGYEKTDKRLIKRAQDDIKKGVLVSDKDGMLNRDEAAQIIYNAMDYPIVVSDTISKNSDGSISGVYRRDESETILKRMDIFLVSGWVNATNEMNLYGGENTSSSNLIQVERQEYKIAEEKYKVYLGRYVDVFVKTDKNGVKNVVSITVNSNESKNLYIIPGEDISSVSRNELSYWENDKKKSVKISSSARVIYNTEYVGGIGNNISRISDCDTIQMIDSNLDGQSDVIVVVNPETYFVDDVKENKILVEDYSKTLDYSDYDSVSVIKDGNRVTLKDITANSIISVIENKKNKSVIIYFSAKSNEGYIKKIDGDGSIYLEGEDEEYKLHRSCIDKATAGEYYIIYMDYRGYVCSIKESGGGGVTSTGRKYAYLRATSVKGSFESSASFRMWIIGKEEGEWVTLEGADKITFINGSEVADDGQKGHTPPRYSLTAAEVANHPAIKDKPQLIVYETNSEGKLSKLTTYQDMSYSHTRDEEVFTLNEKIDKAGMYWQGMFASGKYAYDSNSIGISIPYDRSREELYSYLTFKQATWYNCEVYDALEDRSLGGVVIRYDPSDAAKEFSNNAVMCLVKSAEETLKGDDVILKIVGADDKEYYFSNPSESLGIHSDIVTKYQKLDDIMLPSQIKSGDWLRAEVNSKNEITLFQVYARLSELSDKEFFAVKTDTWEKSTEPFNYSIKFGRVVLNGKSETTSVVNYVGDGTDKANDILMYTGSACKMYDYSLRNKTFTKLNYRNLTTDDKFVQYSEFWYINSMLVRIVD